MLKAGDQDKDLTCRESEKTMRGAKEDPGLAEVKAILSKLQRFDLTPEESFDGASPAETGSFQGQAGLTNRASTRGALSVFARKHSAITAAKPRSKLKGRIAVYLSGAAILIAAAAIFFAVSHIDVPPGLKTAPSKTAPAPDETDGAILAKARLNLSEGDIALARTRLLHAGPERRAEVAFMLAQSYDPNYLQSLQKADSPPDRPEAERWYKKWYELAIQSGLEMDTKRLQRIINAMH